MTRNWVVVAAVIFLVVAASSSEPVPPTASSTEEEAQSADAAVRIGNHLREGNDALASGDYRAAIRSYEACLALDPDERYCNINYASSLVDDVYRNNGSEEEEEEEEDGRDDADEREDRMARAVSALRRVLRLHPRDGDAAFNLALLLQDTSKSEEVTRESAMLYQIAVQAMEGSDPDDGGGGGGGDRQWDALANLAAARQELGEHFGPYGSIRCYERSIVLLEGITQEYNDYIDMMVNEYDAAGSTTMEEYDEEGYRSAQTQVLAMNAYASKLYYGYGTILSELSPSDCLRLTATEKSLLIDTERTTTFAIRAVGDAGDGEGRDDKSARVACEANALNAMRMAVNLDGNTALAIHILAAMAGGGMPTTTPTPGTRVRRGRRTNSSRLCSTTSRTPSTRSSALSRTRSRVSSGRRRTTCCGCRRGRKRSTPYWTPVAGRDWRGDSSDRSWEGRWSGWICRARCCKRQHGVLSRGGDAV